MKKRILAFCLLACALLLTGCARQEQLPDTQVPVVETQPTVEAEQPQEETQQEQAVEVDSPYAFFETAYGQLQFPSQLMQQMQHRETIRGTAAEQTFSMTAGGKPLDVFTVFFGSEDGQEKLGLLEVDGQSLPVTYTACIFTEEDFEADEDWNRYTAVMDGFSTMLNAICADDRFRASAEEDLVSQTVELDYWQVELPAGVKCEQFRDAGSYKAVFRGELDGEVLDLFAICLGEGEGETVLGVYEADGQSLPVSIENYPLEENAAWTEEQLAKVFTMKASINNVIEIITADPAFTAQ